MQISVWEKETFFAPQDVVIIGSGFVGLWSAYYLKKKNPSLKITILERGMIPTGASTRNAGFACFGSLSEVMHDVQQMGTDKTLEIVEMRYKGLQRIQKMFKQAVDFELCGGYELYDPGTGLSTEALQHNADYINALLKPITGTKKTYTLADDRLQDFSFGKTTHLVKNNREGYLHSGKLVQALLQLVQSMGVQIRTSIEVSSFTKNDEAVEITTNQKIDFKARKLLLCTNAFTKQLYPDLDLVPARGQVLLTAPISDLPWRGTFHSDEGYYYFRNLGDRVLLGGARNKAFADEETTTMQTSEFIQSQLETYLSEVVIPNQVYKIEQRWSGIMAMGSEKSPIVKELSPDVFCAVRMSGMGVALAPLVGQKISKQILAQL
jgi:glycine/D-amino acid oxidase-like deaminating enzyme